jgi:hypothetical protein
MDQDKRNRQDPIPANVSSFLSEEQQQALVQFGNFGVELAFIRRPVFSDSIAVLKNEKGDIVGMLKDNGQIIEDLPFQIRH